MKFLFAFVAFAFVTLFVSQAESSCTVSCDTTSKTQVCGKYGTTCRRFSNTCARKLYNCVNGITYAKVAISRCQNIASGSSGTCSSSTTSGVTVAYVNGLSGLSGYSGYSGYSGSSVTPIVIRG